MQNPDDKMFDLEQVHHYNVPTDILLKYAPRPNQISAFDFTKKSIMDNKKYILIDSPVGSGKSFLSMMIMDWYKQHYNPSACFDLLTNSKLLQEQYTRDFEFIKSLWGKENYECEQHGSNCGQGKEFNELLGKKCDECPYDLAKLEFFFGEVSLTNFHMFLTYKMFAPFAWERKARVLIIDEASEFEDVYCDFITNKISKVLLIRNGISTREAERIMMEAKNHKTLDRCMAFIEEKIMPVFKATRLRLKAEVVDSSEQSKKLLKTISSLENNITKFQACISEYKKDSSNWAYEHTTSNKDEFEFTVQPIWAYPYLNNTVWKDYDHIIFMSGTILDRNLFCELNGLDENLTSYISIPSTFPPENRPIYYFNIGKMSYKTKHETFKKQIKLVDRILKKHKSDKGIIHTVNYELAQWVNEQAADNSRLLLHDSKNRQETLDRHYNSNLPTVLCSPSMNFGVDLKDSYSRMQIILKMPYPNLQSEKIKRRMESKPMWYIYATIIDLIQGYGRSVRSETDYAQTYILDSCFSDVLRRGGKFLPKYFKEAIINVSE